MDLEGNVVDQGTTTYNINKAGYVIHSAIHESSEAIKAVMHCHASCGVAVACHKDGLLPICQNAALVHGNVAYHDFEGIAIREGEKQRLVKDLGDKTIMILRHHGLLTCGGSVEEAFYNMYMIIRACEIQVMAMSHGAENVTQPPKDTIAFSEKVHSTMHKEGIGKREFAALLRDLDDKSYLS